MKRSKFKGTIAISAKDSAPDWPQRVQAPAGAPNVVLILLDDMGFADTSTFGGVAQTPELDRLAARGLRYNSFHTTGLCSPTRAALLSGRNHHRVGFGGLANLAAGYPGYDALWKKHTVSFPEVLRRNGYATAAIGKWHNTPAWEISPLGPFDRWPTSLGFDYFYGFNCSGEDNHWEPHHLYRNTIAVDPPATPEQGYHLTADLVDDAIRWLNTHKSVAPEKPYALYFATGAAHYPHHAPRQWIEQYRGRFDAGWDELNREIFERQKQLGVIPPHAELTPRPAEVPSWDSLSANQKRLYARQMEVYAGFITHTDYEVGRLVSAVQREPDAANTLIVYIAGDNGTSAEAGLNGSTSLMNSVEEQLKRIDELGAPTVAVNMYSTGWAWLGSTPFKWWKGVPSHFGGTRDPMVVSWPKRIKDYGGLRSQFTHVNDVAATVFEVARIPFPSEIDGVEQHPLDGADFSQTFDDANASSRHHTQYFETFGNRAIYHDGWIAAAAHSVRTWEWGAKESEPDCALDRWELYHVADDFSEARDVVEQYPEKLKALQELFDVQARSNEVYPLGAMAASFYEQPALSAGKQKFLYYRGVPRLRLRSLPVLSGKSYRITADVVIPEKGASGVILSYGDRTSGFVVYLKQSQYFYESILRNGTRQVIASEVPAPPGLVQLVFDFTQQTAGVRKSWLDITAGTGTGRLLINGKTVGEAQLVDELMYARYGSLGIGRAFSSPISTAFQIPFEFSGEIVKVIVEIMEEERRQ